VVRKACVLQGAPEGISPKMRKAPRPRKATHIDDKLDPIGSPIPLPHARAGHLALTLEIDQVLLIGGVGDGNKGVAEIDIYTAR